MQRLEIVAFPSQGSRGAANTGKEVEQLGEAAVRPDLSRVGHEHGGEDRRGGEQSPRRRCGETEWQSAHGECKTLILYYPNC